MSEQEFENWLALLSGLLKLSPEQRQNISDELRSHLEERMEDLIDAGSSREEAIAAALAEFGDTAALAHHFTTIAHQKRRRLMRYTYGTIAAVTCAILVLAAFWPGPQAPLTPEGIAQSEPTESDDSDSAQGGKNNASSDDSLSISPNDIENMRETMEAELAKPYGPVEYFQVPLREVLTEFGVKTRLSVIVDPRLLGTNGGIDPDVPVDLQLASGWLTAKSVLNDFIIKTYMGKDYGYIVRDGYIWVTSLENTSEVIVYNCRDLLMPASPTIPERAGGVEDDDSAVADIDASEIAPRQFHPAAGGKPSGVDPGTSAAAEQQLIQVISNTVAAGTWNVAGNTLPADSTLGSIDAINGMIVINHTREVHEQVKDLLKLLRSAKEEHGPDGTIYEYPRPVGGFGGGAGRAF